VPPPVPLAPDVIESQEAVLVSKIKASQRQSLGEVVTLKDPVPPPGDTERLVGVTLKVQGAAPWKMVKGTPPTVIVPWRGWPLVLAATEKLTPPLPVPLVAEVMVTQFKLSVAVQLQSWTAGFTVKLPVPPVELKKALLGLRMKLQGTPACVTVKVRPAIVIVPVRDLLDGLACTR
jgi:hypothetical protein